MSIPCLIAIILVVLLFPILLLLWATESRGQRIRRWRSEGRTWQVIANRLGTSPSSARRWALR